MHHSNNYEWILVCMEHCHYKDKIENLIDKIIYLIKKEF